PLFAALVFAQDFTTYNMVTLDPTQKKFCVSVDNSVYPLSESKQSRLLFSGQAPKGAAYHYCILDAGNNVIEQESFDRYSNPDGVALNEIYNRTQTLVDLPALPKLWEYPYEAKFSDQLHKDGKIATLHFQAKEEDIDNMHADLNADVKVQGNMTYIGHDEVKFIKKMQIKLSGRSSRLWPKQSYNIKVKDKKDSLFGLQKFKLRAEPNDPSYMREKIYYDLLTKAAGVPARGSSWVRVILNDKPLGLFLLVDQLDKTWLRAAYGGAKKKAATGILYMGNRVLNGSEGQQFMSDLSYLGDDESLYGKNDAYLLKQKSSDKEDKDFTRLAEFTKQISQSSSFDVQAWNDLLDVDVFLKNMAFEFLQGHMDGYLNNMNNYYVYNHNNKWTWLSNDMDYVMGNSIGNHSNLYTGDYLKFGHMERPLVQAILKQPELHQMYKDFIIKIRNELYNLDILGPRIDGLHNMLLEDVNWDHSLPKVSSGASNPGTSNEATMSEYVSRLSVGGLQLDWNDYKERLQDPNISFDMAVNGETGHQTLYGLKQWIKNKAEEVTRSLSSA
ncbi:hypothetical protein INT43_008244, partial [Umbelopsis isabellina]